MTNVIVTVFSQDLICFLINGYIFVVVVRISQIHINGVISGLWYNVFIILQWLEWKKDIIKYYQYTYSPDPAVLGLEMKY